MGGEVEIVVECTGEIGVITLGQNGGIWNSGGAAFGDMTENGEIVVMIGGIETERDEGEGVEVEIGGIVVDHDVGSESKKVMIREVTVIVDPVGRLQAMSRETRSTKRMAVKIKK